MRKRKYRVSKTDSWEELGEDGERKVLAAIPEGFSHYRNVLVPCHHGNDYEEIDLIVVGPTGIWSIEIKNWRGIAYSGHHPEELVFSRRLPRGRRTSYRDNPYYQARNHAQDLHFYLEESLNEWFPSIHTLVVFASRDPVGINGVNLDRVRYANPSIIYLEEMTNVLGDPRKIVRGWERQYRVKDALSKLHTWDVIQLTNGERKRGLLYQSSELKIRSGAQDVSIDWEDIYRVEVMHRTQSQLPMKFFYRSGDIQIGELLDGEILMQLPNGRIASIKLTEIKEIRTG